MAMRIATGTQVTGDTVGPLVVRASAETRGGARINASRTVFQLSGISQCVAICCAGLVLAAIVGCSTRWDVKTAVITATPPVSHRRTAVATPITATSAPPTRAVAEPAPPIIGVPPDRIESLLLSPAQASGLAGTPLGHQEVMRNPVPAASLVDHPDCAPLVHLNDQTFGPDYTAFRMSRLTDGADDSTHYLFQTVATYRDAPTATRTFQAAFNPTLFSCDGITGQDQNERFESTFEIETVTDNNAKWISTPLVGGQSVGFNCAYEARVQDNVLFGVRLCQPDDGESAATAVMTQQISAKVSENVGH